MAYSLFLGSGPVGQMEIFSAECKRLFDGGESLENAISEGYEVARKASLDYGYRDHRNPFRGYRIGNLSDEENFEKFHPFEVYREYAQQSIPNMSLPIIAIEGETTSHEDFKELIEKLELSGEILPKQMKFSGRPVEWGIGWYQVDPSLPEVNTLISQRGYPSIIAGSHFISIREFGSIGRYGEFEAHANIPHQAVTQLMGDKTHLFFIEEGDFIFDDGRSYRRAIKCENVRPSSRNGMLDFELFGGYFFQKGDEKNRNFEVNIFPRRFVQKYERYGSNSEEQVLVRVQIRR